MKKTTLSKRCGRVRGGREDAGGQFVCECIVLHPYEMRDEWTCPSVLTSFFFFFFEREQRRIIEQFQNFINHYFQVHTRWWSQIESKTSSQGILSLAGPFKVPAFIADSLPASSAMFSQSQSSELPPGIRCFACFSSLQGCQLPRPLTLPHGLWRFRGHCGADAGFVSKSWCKR